MDKRTQSPNYSLPQEPSLSPRYAALAILRLRAMPRNANQQFEDHEAVDEVSAVLKILQQDHSSTVSY